MANGYWRTNGGVITSYTAAQLAAMALAGELTQYATYVASDIGEEFSAPDAYTLVPRNARVLCSLPGFGGTWDGSTDDTAAIQAAADYAYTFDPPRAIELPPHVCIKNSVFIPEDVYVFGHDYSPGKWNTEINPHASISLSTGFMLNFNTTDGTTAEATIMNGARVQGGLFGVFGSNWTENLPGVRLALFACVFVVQDVRQSRLTQAIKKMTGVYTDNCRITNFTSHWSYDQSEYMIEIGNGGGDSLKLVNLNFPVNQTEPAVKIHTSYGAEIDGCINGDIMLYRCVGVTLRNYHAELGKVTNDSGQLAIRDSIWKLASASTEYPIECLASFSATSLTSLALSNVEFIWGDGQAENGSPAEVNVVDNTTIVVQNASRDVRGVGVDTARLGIRLDKSGTPIDVWNDNSFYLSQSGTYSKSSAIGSVTATLGATTTGVYSAGLGTALGGSTLANTTYYYRAQLLLDVANSIGVTNSSAEISKTTGGTGKYINLNVSYGSNSSTMGIWRVYRGTSPGSYDSKVEIHAIGAVQLIDLGDTLAGVPWDTAYGPAGVETVSEETGTYTVTPARGAIALIPARTQVVASGGTPALNCALGSVVTFTATAASLWGAPSNVPRAGERVTIKITQDGTGGWAITWNAAYIFPTAWSNTGNTAGKISSITFVSDGTKLVAQGTNSWY